MKASRILAFALSVTAAMGGIYWFQSGERKAGTAAVVSSGITRELARGPLAAFLVKPERKALADLSFQDGEGKALSLAGWKGRVVLINLWATWCAPCRKEMPALAALQAKLGSKDFEVVAISVDRKGVEASAAFLKETGAGALKLYVEPSAKILNDLKALGLPATVLVDRQGREIGRLLGPAEWDSPEAVKLIEAALAEGTMREFRRFALALLEAEEKSHFGKADFRVRNKIFASLPDGQTGVVNLLPEQQEMLMAAEPGIFSPAAGAWGRQGWTRIDLKSASEATLKSALTMAWRNVAPKGLKS